MRSDSDTLLSTVSDGPTRHSPGDDVPGAALAAVHGVLRHKWHLHVVAHLLETEPLRFSTLEGRLGDVSSKVLSESLSRLEEAGVVDRRVVSDKPLTVEYTLTEAGAALRPVVVAAADWGDRYGIPFEQ